MVEQGDIILAGGIEHPLLVISNNTYNKTGHLIACPVLSECPNEWLTVLANTETVTGYIICDNPRQIDWHARGAFLKSRISLGTLLNVLDRVQALFEYV